MSTQNNDGKITEDESKLIYDLHKAIKTLSIYDRAVVLGALKGFSDSADDYRKEIAELKKENEGLSKVNVNLVRLKYKLESQLQKWKKKSDFNHKEIEDKVIDEMYQESKEKMDCDFENMLRIAISKSLSLSKEQEKGE